MAFGRLQKVLAICLAFLACYAVAEAVKGAAIGKALHELTAAEIEAQLQELPLVKSLNAQKAAESLQTSTVTSRVFAVLFPSENPAINSLLGTLYISGPPNFLLALCPPDIDPASLTIMVAFAVGGLLGDTLFHLLPEIFLGEDSPEHVRFVMLEPNKNLLLGLAIMVGFVTFVAMDKALRIATGGDAHSHHSHSHGPSSSNEKSTAITSGADTVTHTVVPIHEVHHNAASHHPTSALPPVSLSEYKNAGGTLTGREERYDGFTTDASLRQRKGDAKPATVDLDLNLTAEKEVSTSRALGGYLNLIADFTHNITDGLAMSSSFYASPTVGAVTTMAVFFHEIPHEVGDCALLMTSGFSKRDAMLAQFVTALGAVLGTVIGIAIQEFGGNSSSVGAADMGPGLMGTSLRWGDMLLPFTAGTFLYVGTVSVIPELLETGPDKGLELRKTLGQFVAMAAGAGIMLAISWS